MNKTFETASVSSSLNVCFQSHWAVAVSSVGEYCQPWQHWFSNLWSPVKY